MKRLLKIAVSLCFCLVLVGMGPGLWGARAENPVASGSIEANGIGWALSDSGELVFTVLDAAASATIPGMSANSTAEWLAYRSQIKSVAITRYDDTNITSIGDNAFRGCANLTTVRIPDGTVTSMGSNVFYGCTALKTATLGSGLTGIPYNAFYGCSALTRVDIPATVTRIEGGAFSGCSSLPSLTLTDSVTSIGQLVFSETNLRVYVPTVDGSAAKTVSNAMYSDHDYYLTGDDDFALRCSNEGVVTLSRYTGGDADVTPPAYISVLGEGAFQSNKTIKTVTLTDVTSMGKNVFNGCTALETANLGGKLTGIPTNAFYGCSALTRVDIPATVTSIGSGAFSGCSSLPSLTLTDSVTSIGQLVFSETNLRVYVPTVDGSAAKTVSNALYSQHDYYLTGDDDFALRCSNDGVITLSRYTGGDTDVTPPAYIGVLGEGAFQSNETIKTVTLTGVTAMGRNVFNGCTALETATLGGKLTGIPYNAFYGCSALTRVDIPATVTSIGSGAFSGCSSLPSLTLTDSVTSIGQLVFSETNLRVYVPTVDGSAAKTVSNAMYSDHDYYLTGDDDFALRCSNEGVVTLRSYTGSAANAVVPNYVNEIYEYAFSGNTTLKSVTTTSVTGMGRLAFNGCTALETAVLNEGLAVIPTQAFLNCEKLTDIDIPTTVTKIEGSAFSGCTSLASVTLTDNVTEIGYYGAFPAETHVHVPTPDGNAARALSNAYQGGHDYYVGKDDSFALRCSGEGVVTLRSYTGSAANVVVPNHVKVIGQSAFSGNATLKNLTLTAASTIERWAFWECAALETVALNEGMTSIGVQAFSGCAALADINLPDSVAGISDSAFESDNLRIRTGCGSYGAGWAAGHSYTEVEESAPAGGKQLVLLHDWSIDYHWNEDHTLVTATRTCARDAEHDHTETETASATSEVTTEPTCTEMGRTTYTSAAFTNPVFSAQTLTLTDIAALGHIWNAPTYAWNGAHNRVTATRTCQRADHPETETVSATGKITTPATCTEMGKTTYTSAAFANAAFAVQAVTLTDIAALGHDWAAPTYAWNAKYSQVTATRVCNRDGSHVETEQKGTTSEVTTPATCTTKGVTTYTSAPFGNAAFAVQTKSVTNVPALGHDWNEPTYQWNADHTQVTATRTCKRDGSHRETETVSAAAKITTPATCTAKGKTTYTSAAFANAAFAVQTVTLTDVPKLGHDWGEPAYQWNADHTQVTATRVCNRDTGHKETETASAAAEITTPATCTAKGVTTYTSAAFNNAAFAVQTVTLTDVPKLGHDWGEPTYQWNADHTQVTATRVCKRDASHRETETASAAAKVTTAATCTAKGKTTYTSAAFANAAFAVQSVTLTDIPALGHDWDEPTYAWNDAHTRVTATRTCKRDASHRETGVAAATAQVTTPATCTEMGQTTYTTAAFNNAAFTAQTVTLTDVPALGHEWGQVTYLWRDHYTKLSATCVCERDSSHTETETVGVTARIALQPTCTARGKTTYTSGAFVNEAFASHSITLTNIPAKGHTWITVHSIAADGEDGVRGGELCDTCGQVLTANRTVSAQKVLRVPSMMKTIEEEAFLGIAAEQAVIPAGADSLGGKAFANCDNLLLVVIPSSVTSIADDVFENSDVAVICPDGSPAASWCDAHGIPHNP